MYDPVKKSYQFKLGDVYRTRLAEAQRYAVLTALTPIIGSFWGDDMPHSYEKAMLSLRYKWWERLLELREAGWQPTLSDTQLEFLCNCPPFGAKILNKGRRPNNCNRRMLCPFCWARRFVAPGFRQIERVLCPPGYGNRKKPLDYRLIEFSREFKATVPSDGWGRLEAKKYWYEHLRENLNPLRVQYMNVCSRETAVSLCRFIPKSTGPVMLFSGLILTRDERLPPAFKELFDCKEPASLELHGHVTKGVLAKACGNVFRYPLALWKAPAAAVVELVDGITRVRLLSRYQARRPPKSRKVVTPPYEPGSKERAINGPTQSPGTHLDDIEELEDEAEDDEAFDEQEDDGGELE